MLIDATDLILGRMCTVAAKKVLLGEKVNIINCEKVMISGSKANVIAGYLRKIKLGIPLKGPYYPKQADRIVRRTIRGMLPKKKAKGREAFKNVMCHMGVPEKFANQKAETIREANYSKLPNLKYVRLDIVCKQIGGKVGGK